MKRRQPGGKESRGPRIRLQLLNHNERVEEGIVRNRNAQNYAKRERTFSSMNFEVGVSVEKPFMQQMATICTKSPNEPLGPHYFYLVFAKHIGRNKKKKTFFSLFQGKDYDRLKMLEVGADEAERWERRKKKKNPDQGFSTYEDATIRQYNRLVKNRKIDLEEYEREKEAVGEDAFYGRDNTIAIGLHKDSKEAIDGMVDDLEKQISKREKYSRRRIYDDDADINFINERNMKFNKKLERFYGDYTEEIKQNLERGTAV
ncbi:pre-mRNA-splicing factor syf2-like [Penaeus indicus]|uniref:pre-mRNA-splicing factor syf2-like n=1 Tax=Penaeus indicus TaxID=29960 RepID=UPI00300CEEEC